MSQRRFNQRNGTYAPAVGQHFKFQQFLLQVRSRARSIWVGLGLLGFILFGIPNAIFGQCNPSGNPSRFEFNIDPTSMVNIIGQQFCTSQSMGTNCCGMQSSYRCLDLVFNLANGPMGENFSASCQGLVNLMTANGNFDALYFNVGAPSAMGNSTNCAAPINIGNNHTISVEFTGTNMGQVMVEMTVIDNMGLTIFNSMQTASPGDAVILTICKPGFGCLEDEIIFGCCSADAQLSLAPAAPSTICSGASTSLKVTGLNGVAPYNIMMRAASASDTIYFPVIVNDDMDGNNTMDMTTVLVSPSETTTYTAISVEDGAGCVQPVMGQSVTITVNPIPTVDPVGSQTLCNTEPTTAINFSGSVPGTVYNWTNTNTSIGLAASGTGDIPSFNAINTGTTVQVATLIVTPVFSNNGVSCEGDPTAFTITVNPTPTVNPIANQSWCSGDATTAITFSGNVPGTVFNWTNSNTAIGLAASGTGNIPSFISQNPGNTTLVANVQVTPTFTNNGISCDGTPVNFTITVYPKPTVFAGNDQTICQNQMASLAASLGGGATGGVWTGGAGTFGNPFLPVTTYTPNASEYGASVVLTFTTNDPVGPCSAASDALTLTVNTLPLVNAGADVMICKTDNLDLSKLGASFDPNGSGTNTANWSTSGTGSFLPSTAFSIATTYVPSAADRLAGFVTLTLTSGNPPGPCLEVSDQVVLFFHNGEAMVCNDNVMIALDETGIFCIGPDNILEGDVVDSMFMVEVLVNGVNIGPCVDCSHLGKTLQVRVRDKCTGLYCTGSVIVRDNLPPKLTCSDIELPCIITDLTPDYLKNVLGISTAYPIVQENCPPATLTFKDTWNDLSCDDDYIGYVRRVWTAVDASGNKSSCTQYLNFIQQSITQVLFPPDVTLNCSSGIVNTSPAATGSPYLSAFGLDFPIHPDAGYCKLSTTFIDNKIKSCDGTFDIIRTWTVYDWCSPTTPMPPTTNPKYYIQVIKVLDNTGPVLNCPSDLTVSTDPLNCCATTNLPDIIVSDVCSRINSAFARVDVRHEITGDIIATYDVPGSITNFPGNNLSDPDTLVVFGFTPCLPIGVHTVTYTVVDDCGNTNSCTYSLTVADLSPPVPACDEITQVALGIDGMIFVNAITFDDGSYDNCGNQLYFKARRRDSNSCQPEDHFYDQVKFCCEDINDTVTVILRVYDVQVPVGPVTLDFEEEHSNECEVQVYIEDKLKPSCNAPANVTVSCENFDPSLWAYGAATGTDNCCVDTIIVTTNYQLFDTLCNKGTITRSFRVYDCGGQSNQCTQRIIVNYEQDYFVRFPNDWIVTSCDAGSMNWGAPQFFGQDCELLGVSYQDEVFTVVPDACYKIERSWTVINWCTFDPNKPCIFVPNPNPNATSNHPSNLVGAVVSAAGTPAPWAPTNVKISASDPSPTNYSTFWDPNANCYKYKQIIKIIDGEKPVIECPDSTVQVCDLSANNDLLWNAPHWSDPMTGSHDLCEAPTDLCVTTFDACSDTNITARYLLFLDLDNNGTMETVISSANPPDPNVIPFGNANNPNYSGGTPLSFDNRPVPLNQKYRFALQTTVSGGKVQACLRWNTQQQPGNFVLPELPYGTHKIKWIVMDGCGNEQVCEYTFVVKDCKAPTITCINGLSINIMQTGMISINVSDFVKDGADNCTPADLLIYGIRWVGNGTGFPYNLDGTPVTTFNYTCDDLGFNLMEIWAMDLAGNSDFCTTYINVQDNFGICGATNASVAGSIQTENGLGVEDVNMQVQSTALSGQAPINLLELTDNAGGFIFPNALPMTSNATLTPLKDNDPLNGVSTYDLVLINKHILGLAPLGSPYKMIAADANNSRSITTLDIVELRKLILGIYTELPENTSWRFVDKNYVFPNLYNPFQELFPETKQLTDIQHAMLSEDFIAVKTGDVNGNVVTSSLLFVDERTEGTLLFDVEDRLVVPEEVFTLNFKASEPVLGYQFTLCFPELELLEVQPGPGMTASNFGCFPEEHTLTASVDRTDQSAASSEFSLQFRAKSAGNLSRLLSLSSQRTRAEAYREGLDPSIEAYNEMLDVGLRFVKADAAIITGVGFELYQNQPNPWTNTTRIGFHLPESGAVTFSIFDESGRVLYVQNGNYPRGYNSLSVDNKLLQSTGLLYYKLESGADSAVKKMIRM